MSIATEITALQGHLEDAYDTIEDRGGTIPTDKNMVNLPDAIESIPSGGTGLIEITQNTVLTNYLDISQYDQAKVTVYKGPSYMKHFTAGTEYTCPYDMIMMGYGGGSTTASMASITVYNDGTDQIQVAYCEIDSTAYTYQFISAGSNYRISLTGTGINGVRLIRLSKGMRIKLGTRSEAVAATYVTS